MPSRCLGGVEPGEKFGRATAATDTARAREVRPDVLAFAKLGFSLYEYGRRMDGGGQQSPSSLKTSPVGCYLPELFKFAGIQQSLLHGNNDERMFRAAHLAIRARSVKKADIFRP